MLALVIVDMQCAMHGPGRKSPAAIDDVVRRINQLSAAMRAQELPVVFIRHEDPVDGFSPGEPAWEFLPELDRAESDIIVPKSTCDAFYDTQLTDELDDREVDSLIICGWATDYCVDTTVRAAASHNYSVAIAGDAHTAADREHLDAASIIRHHNATWSDLVVPRSIRVVDTAALLSEIADPVAPNAEE